MTDRSENPQSPAACCGGDNHLSTHQPLGADSQDMTLAGLLAALEAGRGRQLSFAYGGRLTKPGYHVTEMKFARVTGVDCGSNAESWSESIFQIWDVEESVTGDRMTVDKLIGITRKVSSVVGAEAGSRLTFEVSDGEEAMRVYAFEGIDLHEDRAVIRLGRRVSACKPLVRGILPDTEFTPGRPGACGPKVAFANLDKKPPCCG